LRIAHFLRDGRHDLALGVLAILVGAAAAVLERLELSVGIIGMLPG